jgi:hypothetical protein
MGLIILLGRHCSIHAHTTQHVAWSEYGNLLARKGRNVLRISPRRRPSPLDVLILMDAPTFVGCLMPARLSGVIEATHDGSCPGISSRIGRVTEEDSLLGRTARPLATRRLGGDLPDLFPFWSNLAHGKFSRLPSRPKAPLITKPYRD